MTKDELFVAVCADLDRLVAIGDEYSMLRASALLRQLLLEGFVHAVNRERKLKLLFPVCGRKYRRGVLEKSPAFYSSLSGIHESGALGHSKELVPIGEFLSEPVVAYANQILSIRDVIDHAANVLGGVHFGIPKSEENIALSGANESVTAFGLPLNATQLKPIAQVALDGLQELRQQCA